MQSTTHLLGFPSFYHRNRVTAYDFLVPSSALRNEHESANFLKKLITVSLSNIFKARGLFPASSFVTYANVDYEVNVFEESKLTGRKYKGQAAYFKRRLEGLFDAIDRKYVKELHVRILSQGNGKGVDDTIELFTFHFTYGLKPIISLAYNGEPMCLLELGQASCVLMDSVNLLLSNIYKMGTSLPPLIEGSKPHLTMWIKKTDYAPLNYVAPFYPPGPLYGRVSYPPMERVMYDGVCTSNEVTTGFHSLSVSHKFAEGEFAESELFQRYYGNKKSGGRRVVELTVESSSHAESSESSSENLDKSCERSEYKVNCHNRFEVLDTDEESEKSGDRREYDSDSDSD